MTEDEEKKLNELVQYDMMGGQTIPEVAGWGTFPFAQGQNTQANNVIPLITNPNPEGA
jgi:hypothetical protein